MTLPKIYSIDEHRLPQNKIDKQAYYIIEKLRTRGFISFLVGGSVRDLLLNVRPKDFDISTSAKPEDIKAIFKGNCILIGKRFRLAHIRFGKKIIEVSTFRSGDINEKAQIILRDNIFGTPQQDVIRRDFTINGLFYDPEVQTLIDYVDGYKDIEKKILRAIGDPNLRFIQDPVRMIRLIKFKARFKEFEIEKETLSALKNCKDEIVKSSSARIFEELTRMLESGSSLRFFLLLNEYKILNLLSTELSFYIEKEKKILDFLKLIDEIILDNKEIPQRSVLISSLLFSVLEKKLIDDYINQNKSFHLGIVYSESKELIEKVFLPFFKISRNLKAQLISILINQFRINPLIKPKKRKIRVPYDPFFHMALQFFELRTMLDPQLSNIFNIWNDKYAQLKKQKPFRKRG